MKLIQLLIVLKLVYSSKSDEDEDEFIPPAHPWNVVIFYGSNKSSVKFGSQITSKWVLTSNQSGLSAADIEVYMCAFATWSMCDNGESLDVANLKKNGALMLLELKMEINSTIEYPLINFKEADYTGTEELQCPVFDPFSPISLHTMRYADRDNFLSNPKFYHADGSSLLYTDKNKKMYIMAVLEHPRKSTAAFVNLTDYIDWINRTVSVLEEIKPDTPAEIKSNPPVSDYSSFGQEIRANSIFVIIVGCLLHFGLQFSVKHNF